MDLIPKFKADPKAKSGMGGLLLGLKVDSIDIGMLVSAERAAEHKTNSVIRSLIVELD